MNYINSLSIQGSEFRFHISEDNNVVLTVLVSHDSILYDGTSLKALEYVFGFVPDKFELLVSYLINVASGGDYKSVITAIKEEAHAKCLL